MPGVRDFLERLRPSGTPGAASISGVPADRVGERSTELAAVLALLAADQAAATSIREMGAAEAQRIRDAAAEQARAVISEALRSAQGVRLETAARARSQAALDAQDLLEAAQQEAARVMQTARTREPVFVERVRALLRDDVRQLSSGVP